MIHVGYSVEISTNLDEMGKQGKERANEENKSAGGRGISVRPVGAFLYPSFFDN